MRKLFIVITFGIGSALLGCEVFFCLEESQKEAETLRLNNIKAGESWFQAGTPLSAPAERLVYQGPEGNPHDFLEPDAELGHRLQKSVSGKPGRLRRDGHSIYDVTYSTNHLGWRSKPYIPLAPVVVAFFGDSYVFGHGLREEETISAQFEKAAGAWSAQAVNFGVPGWGAQQALRLLEQERERGALPKKGLKDSYFLLTKEHLPRIAGLRLESAGAPRYEKGVFSGYFSAQREPVMASFCALSATCEWLKARYGILGMPNLSVSGSEADELVTVLARIGLILRERYKSGFSVILWNEGDSLLDKVEAELVLKGVNVIPVKAMLPDFQVRSQDYVFPFDGHPNARAAEKLGEYLAGKPLSN